MKKTIAKVVAKVTAKTAKAKTKAKSKVARKCAKAVLLAALCAIAGCLEGCLNPAAPSRTQTQMFDRCNFAFYGGGAETNELARVELGTQAMANETSGTESQTVTPRQDNDISPDIKTTVGGATADEKTAPVETKKTDEAVAENATTTVAEAK